MQHKTYKAAIFDMDGTVLNTLEDLTSALNHVLAETGHDHAYGIAQVRQFFGSGVQVAITRALAIEKELPLTNSWNMSVRTAIRLRRVSTPRKSAASRHLPSLLCRSLRHPDR